MQISGDFHRYQDIDKAQKIVVLILIIEHQDQNQ